MERKKKVIKMNLKQYLNKNVEIKTETGVFKGFVSEYFSTMENENEMESIIFEKPAIVFYENEIVSIKVL